LQADGQRQGRPFSSVRCQRRAGAARARASYAITMRSMSTYGGEHGQVAVVPVGLAQVGQTERRRRWAVPGVRAVRQGGPRHSAAQHMRGGQHVPAVHQHRGPRPVARHQHRRRRVPDPCKPSPMLALPAVSGRRPLQRHVDRGVPLVLGEEPPVHLAGEPSHRIPRSPPQAPAATATTSTPARTPRDRLQPALIRAAPAGPMPGRSISCDPRAVTTAASSVLRALSWASMRASSASSSAISRPRPSLGVCGSSYSTRLAPNPSQVSFAA
jgi:hypothetical protein